MFIICVGDSITEGCYCPTMPDNPPQLRPVYVDVPPENTWAYRLAKLLGGGGAMTVTSTSLTAPAQNILDGGNTFTCGSVTVLNAGRAFANSQTARDRFTADVLNRNPDAVVIAVGVNDFQASPTDPFIPLATTQANISSMAAIATGAGLDVVLCGIVPLSAVTTRTGIWLDDEDNPGETFEIVYEGDFSPANPYGRDVSSWIEAYSAAHGHGFVDWFSAMGGVGGGKSMDGIHPNTAGHYAIGTEAAVAFGYVPPIVYDFAASVCDTTDAPIGADSGTGTDAGGAPQAVAPSDVYVLYDLAARVAAVWDAPHGPDTGHGIDAGAAPTTTDSPSDPSLPFSATATRKAYSATAARLSPIASLTNRR